MQQVTRTLSVTSPEHCLVARWKFYFLLKSIIPVSCLFRVKSPKRKSLNAFTSEHQCRNAQEHLGTTDLRMMFLALQKPAEHFVGWRKTFLSGQKSRLILGMVCGLDTRHCSKKSWAKGNSRAQRGGATSTFQQHKQMDLMK